MLEELKLLLKKYSPKHYASAIKRNIELLSWLKEETSSWNISFTIPEMVYLILHPTESPYCKNGNLRHLSTLEGGFRYCGNKKECLCNRSNQSEKMAKVQSCRSNEQKQQISAKVKETCLQRYGVDNGMLIPAVVEKIRVKSKEKYGTEWHTQSSAVIEKTKQNNIEKYGVEWVSQLDDVKNKRIETCIERYGFCDTTHIARQAYIEQTGYSNPFQNPEIKERIKEKLLELYGVEHPLKSEEIKHRREENYISKHGRNNPMQKHFPEHIWKILDNEELFKEAFEKYSILGMANEYEVSERTIANRMIKYEIKLPGRSSYENAIALFLEENNIEYLQNTHKIISNELDFFIPSKNIAIEMCGLYFHSQWSEFGKSNKMYHWKKWKECYDKGINLITIFEDEWVLNTNSVLKRLKHLLGLCDKGIGARKLVIKHSNWEEVKILLEENHLQSSAKAKYKYGAYYNNELVAAMLFSNNPIGDYEYELIRYATNGKHYPGVASKLLKTFIREINPNSIVSFSDNRWSDGNLYNTIGFTFDGWVKPTYWYTDYRKRYHRSLFRKDKLEQMGHDVSLTETEIMLELGYDRIWDCGKRRWIWKNS